MVINGITINSCDIPSLLKRFFLVRYTIEPISWNELLNYVDSATRELDLKLMLERYQTEGKFSALFPEDCKNISQEKIEEVIKDYSNKKDFLKGGYIQVFLENFTDNPYSTAFLDKIGKPASFVYNNYPYGTQLIISNDIELKNHFSIPGNFCKDISGSYHYDHAVDWDFSNQIDTKRLHIKNESGKDSRIKIDTPYKAYMVYAKKEYSKFLIGFNALINKETNEIVRITKFNKQDNLDDIKELLRKDEKLLVNPSFILKFGTDVIEYEAAKYQQTYQLNKILEKVNKRCGLSLSINEFSKFLSSLTINKEIKYKEEYDTEIVKKQNMPDELIKLVSVVVEKNYEIQVDHNKAIDRVLKTFPDNPEPYELDEEKLSQIAKGIFDSEYRMKQELYYEDADLPFTNKQCTYIEEKFKKLHETQLSSEEIQYLEDLFGSQIMDFSITDMFKSILHFQNDAGKLGFYKSLFYYDIWLEICNSYNEHKAAKNKNEQKAKNHELDAESEEEFYDNEYDRIDNHEHYEQLKEIEENYIDLIDPTRSNLWNLLDEKLMFVSRNRKNDDALDLKKEFAENLKAEYWNQKHSWESLYNAYKKRCETPLYSMPHFKAILDYVYSNLVGLEKKVSDKPELIKRFQNALKCKKQIDGELLENFNGEKEKEFVNLISKELSFLCKVVGFHDSRIHVDYEVLLNFIRNFAETGYETYWYFFDDKEKTSIPLKVFYEDRMLSIYENCINSLGGENNDR